MCPVSACDHCTANNDPSTAANETQSLDVSLGGGLASHTSLSVWVTDQTRSFEQQPKVSVVSGRVTLTVPPNAIMTVSSTTGQRRGSFASPPAASAPFPKTWRDTFDDSPPETLAKYWADQCGSFQVMPAGGGRTGHALRQRVTERPGVNQWANNLDNPTTTLGNPTATGDCTVSVDVRVPESAFLSSTPAPAPRFEYAHGQINGGVWKISGEYTLEEAEALCIKTNECQALTFASSTPKPPAGQKANIWLTSRTKVDAKSTAWQSYLLSPAHVPPPPAPPLGVAVCGRVTKADWPAVCLQLDADPHSPAADAQWRIADSAATNVIAHGTAAGVSLAAWHRLELAFTAGNVSASLDGKPLGGGALGPTSATTGMVELQSGWHVAEFDNFALVSK